MVKGEIDYVKLKFKSGLEIHQQLDSSKLFCRCPSLLRKDEPDFVVKRKLHAVAGESGEVDVAAQHQSLLDKDFEYQGYNTTCLVELDEEPAHEINKEALKIALHISLLLNCKIIPITQIMRKTVIDGSNTSGFQRTVLIAKDGWLDAEYGPVGIESVLLEEDAARIVERLDGKEIYKLDRLGIPLVEIVTAPDIKTPEQAKQIALQIGDILRSCKVKRGIGTIRQDVNVSIRNGNRVEIKGMQNMKIFVKAIENEVLRQEELSDSKKPTGIEVRNVLPDATTKFMRPLPGSARMYPETDLPLLKISRDFINGVKKTLPRLIGDFEGEPVLFGQVKDGNNPLGADEIHGALVAGNIIAEELAVKNPFATALKRKCIREANLNIERSDFSLMFNEAGSGHINFGVIGRVDVKDLVSCPNEVAIIPLRHADSINGEITILKMAKCEKKDAPCDHIRNC